MQQPVATLLCERTENQKRILFLLEIPEPANVLDILKLLKTMIIIDHSKSPQDPKKGRKIQHT
jgi:hypothetical protein